MNFDLSIIVHLTIDLYDAEKGFSPLLEGFILEGVIIFIEGYIELACNSSTHLEFWLKYNYPLDNRLIFEINLFDAEKGFLPLLLGFILEGVVIIFT